MPQSLDVLQIHPDDNICVATRKLPAGTFVVCGEISFELTTDAALGSKLSLRALSTGDKIIKFGEPIGSLTADVAVGDYVHTHNLESDYIHTYQHGELISNPRMR